VVVAEHVEEEIGVGRHRSGEHEGCEGKAHALLVLLRW